MFAHRYQAYAEAVFTVLLMSTVPIVIRGIDANPWVIGVARLLIASSFLYLVARRARTWIALPRADKAILSLIGLTFGAHWTTYFWSIKWASAQIATIGVSTYGIFVSVLGAALLGHRIRLFHVAGIGCALIGTIMVAGGLPATGGSDGLWVMAGLASGVLAGFLYALLPIYHQRFRHLSTAHRTIGQNLFGLVFFLPFIPLGNWQVSLGHSPTLLGLLYLGIFGTVVCHTLWIRATTVLPTTHAGIIYYLYVPSGCLLGYFLLGERLSPAQLLGAGLILAGSLIGIVGDSLRYRTNRPT